jgi:hypothetical protein
MRITKTIACITLALALAGCDGGNYSSGGENSDGDAGAALLLMGATAFMNGMNQARPVTTTCFTTGMMTTCQ